MSTLHQQNYSSQPSLSRVGRAPAARCEQGPAACLQRAAPSTGAHQSQAGRCRKLLLSKRERRYTCSTLAHQSYILHHSTKSTNLGPQPGHRLLRPLLSRITILTGLPVIRHLEGPQRCGHQVECQGIPLYQYTHHLTPCHAGSQEDHGRIVGDHGT
jgi:hypothetical protein